jgi:hypothetical protein
MEELRVGSTITYTLPLSECPVNPAKQWHGRIVQINVESYLYPHVIVESLDPGYEGMREYVFLKQIVPCSPRSGKPPRDPPFRKAPLFDSLPQSMFILLGIW